ncbi:filamentous hemagglutinin N-terminal domain-containing protein [Phormidium tenue FACHB-886]|nr:filamentous hemagglutinin N-terminal domain-containing protein [Phormidium tenue FACHB-886]
MNRLHLSVRILTSSIVGALLCVQPIAAQVVPDNALPAGERSQVSGDVDAQIDGGARRGGNLFHSFRGFSVPTGGSAYFNNAADVQNIFSRVTGGSISNIDGLIRANGTANLFLLNPNGILFGPNASLNIGGSFLATTADAIGFPTGEVFSSDATQPLPSQLLTVNPNALFFNQLTPQPIVNQARFDERVFSRSSVSSTGLHVPPGQNLLLVGGAVQFDSGEPFSFASSPRQPLLVFFLYPGRQEVQPSGGWLASPSSYVELGAVGGVGTVELSTATSDWQLAIPNGVPRADISFSNGSGIAVRGASGSIRVLAQNIDLSRSLLWIGVPSSSTLSNIQTGDLDLNAIDSITMNLSVLNNLLYGQGTTGSINLTASDRISFDTASILNIIEPTGVGNAGNININTGSFSLTNRSFVQSYIDGQGNIGNVNINARDRVSLRDSSEVSNRVNSTGIGNAGNINITTGSLFLTDARLSSYIAGQGNAGSVNINARDTVSLIDAGLNSYTSGQGNAGSVNINARDRVSLHDSLVFNIVFPGSIGNSGGINITTRSLSLTAGSSLYSDTAGQGDAGNVTINARDRASLDGISSTLSSYNPSSIFTRVAPGAVGQGGNVIITTGVLSLTNGGAVNTTTQARGNAGRVTIQADDVQVSGAAPSYTNGSGEVFDFPSGVTTSARSGSVGNGGDVTITTGSLSVSDQGRINTTAQGQGNAGDVQIQASDTVLFDGGDVTSTLDASGRGRGGNIEITGRSLSVLNNAQLSASTAGNGNAGNLTIRADTVRLSSGGRLLATTSSRGRAGNITVRTPDLQLSGSTSGLFAGTSSAGDAGNLSIQPHGNGQRVRVNLQDNAQISASTTSSGRGGQLTIAAPESIILSGNGSVIAAGTGGSGNGGNLSLQTGTLNIQNQAEVTVSSSGTGQAGSLFVDANRILLNNGGSIRADTSGGGGNINLRSPFILLRNGSNITTNAIGSNIPGGNITIDTQFLVAVPNENSNISANSEDFRGGNITINAVSLFGIQSSLTSSRLSDITATGATAALRGAIDVTTAGIDPTSGLVALPTGLVNASQLIAQGCPANENNSFVITGRGGLPPTPEQQLDDARWGDRRRLTVPQQINAEGDDSNQHSDGSSQTLSEETRSSNPPIVEATSWQTTDHGEILLVASTLNPTMQSPFNLSLACNGGQ